MWNLLLIFLTLTGVMAIYLCARARKIKHNMLQFVCTNGKNFWFIFGWLFNTGALRKLYLDADLRWYLRQLIQSLHCTRNQDHWLEVRVRWSLYVTENCFPCLREKKTFSCFDWDFRSRASTPLRFTIAVHWWGACGSV